MADVVSPYVRSRMMAGIQGKNTRPEMLLRSGLHSRGFRYQLHRRDLPGKPDLVFPGRKAVLFAHGCFWHGHNCHLFKWPNTRPEFWNEKISLNRERDAQAHKALTVRGWRIAVVWECALKGRTKKSLADVLSECETWLHSRDIALEIKGSEARASV